MTDSRLAYLIAFALALLILAALTLGASAQTTCQQIGNQTFCNGPNGSYATGQRIGTMEFWNGVNPRPNDSFGSFGQQRQWNTTCQQIGNMRVCN